MNSKSFEETRALIAADFEIEGVKETFGEEELLEALAHQIAYMIEYRLEFLLSLMYRLDVAEAKVNAALDPAASEPPNRALAKLVLERQKERVRTKREYASRKGDDLEGMEW